MTLLVAGCGDSGTSSNANGRPASKSPVSNVRPPPRAAGDAGIAQFGLMRREDVPATVVAQDDTRNHASCSPRRLFRRLATAIATTPRYRTDSAEVQESVLLFRDAATAARAFRVLDSPAKHRCIASDVRQAAIERLQQQVGEPTELALTVEPTGQESSAYRLALPVPGETPSVDILVSRIGRALASTSLVWKATPPDLEFQEALVTHIAAQVRRALG